MRRTAAISVLIAGVAMLSGCAGDDDPPAAPAPTPEASATAEQCGAVGSTVRDHLQSADVRTVTVNGQCTNVTIETGLDDEDAAGGRQLCETAAEVAYVGDVNSVTVVSGSGAELSAGIPGMKCLP
jgi:hypothetical protein